MIVDANVLLYARNSADQRHDAAKAWLESALNGDTRVGLPWWTTTAFMRIATNSRIFDDPLTMSDAWDQVSAWLAAPRAWIPEPTSRFTSVLGGIVERHRVQGAMVTDAVLAALALDHGVAVVSADADFARFDEIRWIDPFR